MTISTFSGAHPFRAPCLIEAYIESADPGTDWDDAADEVAILIEKFIDKGLCPRCGGDYVEGEIPSGSRVSDCRCIPVCMECSRAEVYGLLVVALDRIKGPEDAVLTPLLLPVCMWGENDRDAQTRALAAYELAGDVSYTEVPAGDLLSRPHPGGWLEHGYDDTQDREEREG